MGSVLCVAADVDIRIMIYEMGKRCKYYYILKRKKKGNNNGHHQAFIGGYDISKEEENMGIKYYIKQG